MRAREMAAWKKRIERAWGNEKDPDMYAYLIEQMSLVCSDAEWEEIGRYDDGLRKRDGMNYEADKADEKPIARGIRQAAEQADGAVTAGAGLVAMLLKCQQDAHMMEFERVAYAYGRAIELAEPFDAELVRLRARVVELERAMACYAQKSASAVGMPDAAWSWEQHWNDMVKHFRDILKKEQK